MRVDADYTRPESAMSMILATRQSQAPETPDRLLVHYGHLNELIDRALAAIVTQDISGNLILAAAVVAKTHVLDAKLGLIEVTDLGGQARPPEIFDPASSSASSPSSSPRRRRRSSR